MTWLAEWRAENVDPGPMTIPRRYQQAALERIVVKELRQTATSYLNKFYSAAAQGRAPVFIGQAGTGKSMTAAFIARRIYEGVPLAVEWQNCASWQTWLRTEPREVLAKRIRRMQTVPFLVLDDMHAVSSVQPETFALLSGVLSERWDNCYPTILIANLDLPAGQMWESFAEIYSPALERRVREGSEGFTVLV